VLYKMIYLRDIPAICQRCQLRGLHAEMVADVNSPGLMVHPHCADMLDPYRLAPRETEDITLAHPRPDVNIGTAIPFLITEDEEYVMGEEGDFLQP